MFEQHCAFDDFSTKYAVCLAIDLWRYKVGYWAFCPWLGRTSICVILAFTHRHHAYVANRVHQSKKSAALYGMAGLLHQPVESVSGQPQGCVPAQTNTGPTIGDLQAYHSMCQARMTACSIAQMGKGQHSSSSGFSRVCKEYQSGVPKPFHATCPLASAALAFPVAIHPHETSISIWKFRKVYSHSFTNVENFDRLIFNTTTDLQPLYYSISPYYLFEIQKFGVIRNAWFSLFIWKPLMAPADNHCHRTCTGAETLPHLSCLFYFDFVVF